MSRKWSPMLYIWDILATSAGFLLSRIIRDQHFMGEINLDHGGGLTWD